MCCKHEYIGFVTSALVNYLFIRIILYLPYTYKFSRDVIFADQQFSGFLQFNFRGSLVFQQVYLVESIKVTLIFIIFKDENFVESKAIMKSAKFTSLENLYVYSMYFA